MTSYWLFVVVKRGKEVLVLVVVVKEVKGKK